MPRLRLLLLLLIATTGPAGLAADEPGPLLELVGDDVGFLVEAVEGKRTVEAAFSGEFAKRLRDTSLYKQWLSGKDFRNLQNARRGVERVLGQPVEALVGDLIGREFVLALFPKEGVDPESVLLMRAESEEALLNAIQTWDRLQPPADAVFLSHGGRQYRQRRQGGATIYYLTDGSLFAASQNEARIQAILDRLGEGRDGSVLSSDRYRQARAEVADDVAALAYFNPRAWDGTLPEPRDPEGLAIKSAFDATESMVVALRTKHGAVLDAVVRYDESRADERWRRYVQRIDGESRFLDRVPSRALYVGIGRMDVATIAETIYGTLGKSDRRKADPWRRFLARRFLNGFDPIDDVLPQLGPEWGAYVVPREELVAGASPVDGLVAVGLPNGEDASEEAETARRALDDLLVTGLELWVAVHNSNTDEPVAEVRTREEKGARVRWIEGIGPYRPAYAMLPDYIVLSSTPSLVPEFAEPSEERLVDLPTFRKLRERYFASANQLVFLNIDAGRRFVAENREFLLSEIARQRGEDPATVAPRALRVEELLNLVDGVFVAGSVTSDHVRLVVGAVTEDRPASID